MNVKEKICKTVEHLIWNNIRGPILKPIESSVQYSIWESVWDLVSQPIDEIDVQKDVREHLIKWYLKIQ